ncbi:hypothetical protein ACFSSA_02635 [Luteolibacter algae]|uniref:PEP-CTERM protein-sorting domain-containing protein n=1 Tax=Luteolibacter algae TaxID=454151 RepID=A0ABW5D491_9BACT
MKKLNSYGVKPHKQFVSLFLVAAGMANGAVLFSNAIEGADPNDFDPYTTGQIVLEGLTVSGIGRGAGIASSNADDRYNARGFNETSAGESIADDAYFTLSLIPDAGKYIDFTDFVFTGQASDTGPTSIFVRSSLDMFAADLGSPTTDGGTINLSASTFQGVSSAVEFRIYGYGGTSAQGTFSINDFVFNGEVVPEPSVALLGAAGGLLLLRRRR